MMTWLVASDGDSGDVKLLGRRGSSDAAHIRQFEDRILGWSAEAATAF